MTNFKVSRANSEDRLKAMLKLIFLISNSEMSDKYLNILYEYIVISRGNAKYYTFSRPARKMVYGIVKKKYGYNLNTKSMFPVLKKLKDIKIVTTDEENISYFTDRFIKVLSQIDNEKSSILVNINFNIV